LAAYHLDHRDEFTSMLGLVTREGLEEYQKNVIREIRDEVRSIGCGNILFSCEHLQSRLVPESDTVRLCRVLKDIGFDNVKIIMYVRNPVELAESLFFTAIKCGATYVQPPPPDEYYFHNICNHQRTIQKFEKVFGEGSVIVRPYDRSKWADGSLVRDFFASVGIPWFDDYYVPENQNVSMSGFGILVLSRINEKMPMFIDGKPNSVRSGLMGFFENAFKKGKYQMSNKLRDQYVEAFGESNQWVSRRYFNGDDSMFSCDDSMEVVDYDELCDVIRDTAEMIRRIWLRKR